MSDPKYVRLADRVVNGSLVDTRSHWGITGLDVQEFPGDNDSAAVFVREALRRGNLEPASKAEFDEIQEHNEAFRESYYMDEDEKKALMRAGQEAQVVREAAKVSKTLQESRSGVSGSGAAYEADQKRREALVKAQKELDKGGDPEDDEATDGVVESAPQAIGDVPVVTEEDIPADQKAKRGGGR